MTTGNGPTLVEAAALAGVACSTHLINFHENGVAVAIQAETLHILHMTGRVSFATSIPAAIATRT